MPTPEDSGGEKSSTSKKPYMAEVPYDSVSLSILNGLKKSQVLHCETSPVSIAP